MRQGTCRLLLRGKAAPARVAYARCSEVLTEASSRISLAYQTNARKQPGYARMPWATYIAGYLIMVR